MTRRFVAAGLLASAVDVGWRVVVATATRGPLLDRKYAALVAHASQTAGLIERVGEQRFREWWRTEAFVTAAEEVEQAAA